MLEHLLTHLTLCCLVRAHGKLYALLYIHNLLMLAHIDRYILLASASHKALLPRQRSTRVTKYLSKHFKHFISLIYFVIAVVGCVARVSQAIDSSAAGLYLLYLFTLVFLFFSWRETGYNFFYTSINRFPWMCVCVYNTVYFMMFEYFIIHVRWKLPRDYLWCVCVCARVCVA